MAFLRNKARGWTKQFRIVDDGQKLTLQCKRRFGYLWWSSTRWELDWAKTYRDSRQPQGGCSRQLLPSLDVLANRPEDLFAALVEVALR